MRNRMILMITGMDNNQPHFEQNVAAASGELSSKQSGFPPLLPPMDANVEGIDPPSQQSQFIELPNQEAEACLTTSKQDENRGLWNLRA